MPGTRLKTLNSATNLLPSNPAHQTLKEIIYPFLIAHTFWPFDVDFTGKHLFDFWCNVFSEVTEFYIENGFAMASGHFLGVF